MKCDSLDPECFGDFSGAPKCRQQRLAAHSCTLRFTLRCKLCDMRRPPETMITCRIRCTGRSGPRGWLQETSGQSCSRRSLLKKPDLGICAKLDISFINDSLQIRSSQLSVCREAWKPSDRRCGQRKAAVAGGPMNSMPSADRPRDGRGSPSALQPKTGGRLSSTLC